VYTHKTTHTTRPSTQEPVHSFTLTTGAVWWFVGKMEPRDRRRLLVLASVGTALLALRRRGLLRLRWFLIAAVGLWLRRRTRQLDAEASSGESARVIFRRSSSCASREELTVLVEKIVKRLARKGIKSGEGNGDQWAPVYRPPVFASGPYSVMALFVAKCALMRLRTPQAYTRQSLGPDLHIDWFSQELAAPPAANAPILIVLPTITGDGASMLWFVRAAAARGWRVCVFVRRGHGGPLHRACFNLLGEVEDCRQQVAAVRAKHPATTFIGMVGVSAGSGLLVSYLGQEAAACPVGAACSLCPAYDIESAFQALAPVANHFLVRAIKDFFIERNAEVLRRRCPHAVDACISARTMLEFMRAHAPFSLANQTDDVRPPTAAEAGAAATRYFERNNPMNFYSTIHVPTLLLNADDDVICLGANVERAQHLMLGKAGALLVRTKRGGHVAYCEGTFGEGSFLERVSLDFLDAARDVAMLSSDATC
jgi:predicted alpha/beta-fold hydrolase